MFGLKKKEEYQHVDLVSPKWIEEVQERVRYTPDMWRLEQHQFQPVFLFNEMMSGHHQFSEMVGDAIHFCDAFTVDRDFKMWKHKLGKLSSAIALKEKKPSTGIWFRTQSKDPLTKNINQVNRAESTLFVKGSPSRIKGELYFVRSSEVRRLDTYMKNTVQCTRVKTTLLIPYFGLLHSYPPTEVEKVRFVALRKAWMYIGVPEYWNDLLDGGMNYSLVNSYPPNSGMMEAIGEYYYFSLSEYKAR